MLKEIRDKILELKNNFVNQYGKEVDKAKIKKNFFLINLSMLIIVIITKIMLSEKAANYFLLVAILVIPSSISLYFFRKKEGSKKYKRLRFVTTSILLIILFIVISPMCLILGIFNLFAHISNKIYALKRNPTCFTFEMIYMVAFAVALIEYTAAHMDNGMQLSQIYIVMIILNKIFTQSIRFVLIGGKKKSYEKYRYKKEVDVISEYLFLITSTVSILFQTTDYSLLFIPVLLWYSIKQISSFRQEAKLANLEKRYFLEILEKLEEINDIYVESVDGKLHIENHIDRTKLYYYKLANERKLFVFYLSKKRVRNVFERIEEITMKSYRLPKNAEQAHNDIDNVLNEIVQCI